MPMGKGTYGSMRGRPMKKKSKVMGNRKKLDMDKDGKLTKKDFAMLRNKKNIHAKRKRGGKMRKKGAKGAPKASDFARAKQTVRKK